MQYGIKLKFDLICDPQQDSVLRDKIAAALSQFGEIKNFTFGCKKEKPAPLENIAVFTPDEVLAHVEMGSDKDTKKPFQVGDKTYNVRMSSQRYFLFKTSRKCVACGIEGTKMILQKHPHDQLAHFNLFAVGPSGKLILMTKDHIRAKSVGGEDRHTNYQTMCCLCNNLKGSDDLSIEDIAQLRKIYDENIKKLTKKALNQLLLETKRAIKKKKVIRRPNKTENGYFAKCDINIYEIDSGLIGVAVYDKIKDGFCIGCIPKDTKFHYLEKIDKQYLVPVDSLKENGEKFTLFEGLVMHRI